MLRRAVALAALCVSSHAQSVEFDSSYVQFDGMKAGDAQLIDVDGDGRLDLVVAAEGDDLIARRIEIFLHHKDGHGFSTTADRALDVPRDVIAFAVADVDPAPGRELVLCSATLAVGMRWPEGGGPPRAFRIAPIELLWQPPNLPHTFLLSGCVADTDGDGLDDLLIPEPSGYRALVQRRDADGGVSFLGFPLVTPAAPVDPAEKGQARLRAQAGSIRLRVRDKDRARMASVVEIEDEVPIPLWRDFDGDGDLDVAALVDHLLCVWRWQDGFGAAPSTTFTVPDSGSSLLNPSRSAQLADLNGDRHLDLVAVTGKAQGDDIESRVEIWLQRAEGTFEDKPDDRLLLRGFVDVPRLCDIDGDGRPELVIGSLRTDVLSALSKGGSGSIEAQLNVFRNEFAGRRPRFGRPVALAERITLPADIVRGRVRDRMIATWPTDVDGDGLRDFLQRTDPTTVRLRATTRTENGFENGTTLWQTRVDARARVMPGIESGKLLLVVLDGAQVIALEQR